APLLGAVLPGDWPTNEFIAEMTGEIRADNTNRLLLRLLSRATAEAPLLVTLDDCQWLDSASWTLTPLAARDLAPMLLVLTSSPSCLTGSQGSGPRTQRSAVPSSPGPGARRPATPQAPPADPLPSDPHQLLYAPTTYWLRLDALPPDDIAALVCQRLEVGSLP